jgi:hypothetical protein
LGAGERRAASLRQARHLLELQDEQAITSPNSSGNLATFTGIRLASSRGRHKLNSA